MILLIYLILGHFVADITFQSDFMAKFKHRINSIPQIPWYYVMTGHCATHAMCVALLIGNIFLGLAEFIAHFIIDTVKCEGYTNIHVDQFLHLFCKIVYAFLIGYHYV